MTDLDKAKEFLEFVRSKDVDFESYLRERLDQELGQYMQQHALNVLNSGDTAAASALIILGYLIKTHEIEQGRIGLGYLG